jgi:L-lactate dehydrogenase
VKDALPTGSSNLAVISGSLQAKCETSAKPCSTIRVDPSSFASHHGAADAEVSPMKVGIVGTGAVGCACANALVMRGSARDIVLVDRTQARAKAVATDIRYGTPLFPRVEIVDGPYEALADAGVVLVTVGVNEKTGGATDRNDPAGRLRLLNSNAKIYQDVVPRVVRAAPDAVILVVTDPPDPLADIARKLAGHDRVLSTGTYLDSLRFRVHLAQRLGVGPDGVEAQVVGEHGTSQVFLWSSARISGAPVKEVVRRHGHLFEDFRRGLEQDVRYANISIIEGNNASQFGIGMVSARIAEIVVRDEHAVVPIGSYNARYGVTLSLPSVVGRTGVIEILDPDMSEEERAGLARGAENLKQALARAGG